MDGRGVVKKIAWMRNFLIALAVGTAVSAMMLVVTGEPVGIALFIWYLLVSQVVGAVVDLYK